MAFLDTPKRRYSVFKAGVSWFVGLPNGHLYGPCAEYEDAAKMCRRLTDARKAAMSWRF